MGNGEMRYPPLLGGIFFCLPHTPRYHKAGVSLTAPIFERLRAWAVVNLVSIVLGRH
jgi:hypothetical protein